MLLFAALMTASAQAVRAEPLHPALWKVTKGKTTVWLFGTIHMLQPGADWCNGPVAAAADSADEIVTEVLDPAGEETQAAVRRHAFLPAGEHLAALLPPDEKAALFALIEREHLPLALFDTVKPWYAAVVLSSVPLIRRGFGAHDGVEATLTARESPRHPHLVALETADQQLAILDGLPQAVQVAYLGDVLAQFPTIDREIDAMARAWGKGDAEELARLINEDEGHDQPLLNERLILARNRHWATWIAERLKRPGTAFLAVGAGHLAGPGNVREDLAALGFAVERVQ